MRRALAILLTLASASSTGLAHSDPFTRLFAGDSPITLRLTGPFNELFLHDYDDGGYHVTGTLALALEDGVADEWNVDVSVRGNSSKWPHECSFPKLKIRAGDRTIKLGTHCGEHDDGDLTPVLGRWANEKSPPRETLVYSLVAATGVRTLRARTARVTYIYTDAKAGQVPDQRQLIVRNAMLLEDDDDAIRRLGGDHILEGFTDAERQFTREDALDVVFAEAMIGNLDWCLSFTATDPKRCDAHVPIYNILAVERRNGAGDRRTQNGEPRTREPRTPNPEPESPNAERRTAIPLLYDFDLSGMVAGRREWFAHGVRSDFQPPRAAIEAEILLQLQRMRSFYSRAELDAARQRFIGHKREAYAVVASRDVDAIGKRIITAYLDAFFAILETDGRFYG